MSTSVRARFGGSRIGARLLTDPVWLLLGVLLAASIVVRYLLGRRDPSPWIFVDEMIYSELGRSFASDGEFALRGIPSNAYGYVYPILIAPSYTLFESLSDAYGAVKVTNAVVMSVTVIPVYLIARRLMRPWHAFGAALLSVAIPAMTYTGVVMTENAFYPAFAFTILATVAALERPTMLNQLWVLVSIAVAFFIRTQAVAFIPAYVGAIVLYAFLEARSSGELGRGWVALKRFWLTWLIGASAVVLFLVLQLARGRSLDEPLGAYSVVADGDRYSVTAVSRWFLYHVAELDLWTGIIPLAALILLSGWAFRRESDQAERAFVAAALPALVALTLVVAAFASQSHENRIEERNLFYVGVLLLIPLMWWVDRGLPRPRRLTAFALIVAAALPGVIPFAEFINVTAVSDTFGLLPVWGLQERLVAPNHIPAVVMLVAIIVATVALVIPRRLAWSLPLLIVAYFALAHSPIENRTNGASAATLPEGIQTQVDWIDSAVAPDASVAALWTSRLAPQTIWLNEFFNRRVGQIYYLESPVPGNLPETAVGVDPTTGELRDSNGEVVRAEYVLVDSQTAVAGEVVASDPGRGMQLIDVSGDVTIADRVTGLFADDWSGADATYTRFACTGGAVDVSLSSDASIHQAPQTVTAFSGETVLASVTLDPAVPTQTFTVPLVVVDGACPVRFEISPTAIPAEVAGLPDTRALGVRFQAFTFTGP